MPSRSRTRPRTWPTAAAITAGFVALLWVVEAWDQWTPAVLDDDGIRPRSTEGLLGIVLAPLLHGSWGHLEANTPLVALLLFLVLLGDVRRGLAVTGVIWLVAGLGTWLVASPGTVHVGASGLVFGWLVYLVLRGWFAQRLGQVLLGALLFLAYGGLLWGVLPGQPGISWQGHLFGAVGGLVAARRLATRGRARREEPDAVRFLTVTDTPQTDSEQQQDLRVERGDGVVEVTFDRPHRHNAFTRDMYAQMRELCAELAEDRDTRVLVLRGAGGRAFAAGNEISDFLEQDAVAYEDWIRELLEALFALPQVTVAAVDGVCVGGGLAVATHCDLRIATPHSRFGYPIARTLGNALAGSIVYRCASVFGESLTREMLLASRLVDAPRAHAVGALMSVTDDLDAELERVIDGLRAASPVTIRATKSQLLDRARRLEASPEGDRDLLREVYTGPDFAEGVRAFLAKEKPAFRG